MMKGHIDIGTLSNYFLNRLASDKETEVQEHLSSCPECKARLDAIRRLRDGFFLLEESSVQKRTVIFKVLHSGWTKAAAAVILVAGIGIFTYETVSERDGIVEQQIRSGTENEVFAIDTFDREDSLYYKEKYGEDFKF